MNPSEYVGFYNNSSGSVQISATPVQVVAADPERFYLRFNNPGTGTVTLGVKPDISSSNGLYVLQANQGITLTLQYDGPIIYQAWYMVGSGIGFFLQWLASSWRENQ